MTEWCEKNNMIVSPPKSSSMLCATRQRLAHTAGRSLKIQIYNNEIPCVTSTKILGVYFDQQLTWNEQITHIHKKIASNLYLLKQIKKYLPLKARKLFYNSYVLPHLDYCSVIWGNCSKTTLAKLLKQQKRAAYIILDNDYSRRSHELFLELNWMPLKDRIDFKRAIQVYNCLYTANQGLNEIFQYDLNIHHHNTKSATGNNLHIKRDHPKSFSRLGATLWNCLPISVRNAKNLRSFKTLYINNYSNAVPQD